MEKVGHEVKQQQ